MCQRCDDLHAALMKAIEGDAEVQRLAQMAEEDIDAKLSQEEKRRKGEVPTQLGLAMMKAALVEMVASGATPENIVSAFAFLGEGIIQASMGEATEGPQLRFH